MHWRSTASLLVIPSEPALELIYSSPFYAISLQTGCTQPCWELPFSSAKQGIKTAPQIVSGHHICIICNGLDLSNKGKCWKDQFSLCNTALSYKTTVVIILEACDHDTWVLLCMSPFGSSCVYSFHISTNVNPQKWKTLRDSSFLSSWMFQK